MTLLSLLWRIYSFNKGAGNPFFVNTTELFNKSIQHVFAFIIRIHNYIMLKQPKYSNQNSATSNKKIKTNTRIPTKIFKKFRAIICSFARFLSSTPDSVLYVLFRFRFDICYAYHNYTPAVEAIEWTLSCSCM